MTRPVVTITGFERFWLEVMSSGLREYCDGALIVRQVPWPSTAQERVRFLRAMLGTHLAVRLGMPFEFQSETNRLWLEMVGMHPRLAGVNYWIGTDVATFVARAKAGELTAADRRAMAMLDHLAPTENLTLQLAEVGVFATTVAIPAPDVGVPAITPPLPETFRVLSYWPDTRADFYSAPAVLDAAERMPDVHFDIVGASGRGWERVPENVTFHGRVPPAAMGDYYRSSVVVVRMTEHDCVPGGTVEEALCFARHVVFSHEWPHTRAVAFADSDGLVSELRRLQQAFDTGTLRPNEEGRKATLHEAALDRRYAELCGVLSALARSGRSKRADRERPASRSGRDG